MSEKPALARQNYTDSEPFWCCCIALALGLDTHLDTQRSRHSYVLMNKFQDVHFSRLLASGPLDIRTALPMDLSVVHSRGEKSKVLVERRKYILEKPQMPWFFSYASILGRAQYGTTGMGGYLKLSANYLLCVVPSSKGPVKPTPGYVPACFGSSHAVLAALTPDRRERVPSLDEVGRRSGKYGQ